MLRCPLCSFMNGCSSAGKYMLGIPKNSDSILGISRKDKEALLSLNHCQQYCARWTNCLTQNHQLLMFLCSPHPTPPTLSVLLFIVVNSSFWEMILMKVGGTCILKKTTTNPTGSCGQTETVGMSYKWPPPHCHPKISLPWFEFCNPWISFAKYDMCRERSKLVTSLSLCKP